MWEESVHPSPQLPSIPTPYLRGVADPAHISEDGIGAHRHVLQDYLKPQSHHGRQPAHQGRVHSTRHATLRVRNPTLTFNLFM